LGVKFPQTVEEDENESLEINVTSL